MIDEGAPSDRVEVLVNLRDTITVPRLPELPLGVTRDSATGQQVLAQREAVIDRLVRQRGQQQAALRRDIEQRFDVRVQEQFWLANAFLADMPLGAVRGLAQVADVLHIQPRFAGEAPPHHDGNSANDVADARARIVSDPYFNLGLTGGYIGLLDTGVRSTHTLFTGAGGDHLGFLRDCVNGGTNCNDSSLPGYDPGDNCGWFGGTGHGTSSAAIITGNTNMGNAHRGVTAITLDSFRVYTCTGLDSAAVLRGFQRALALADRVIVAEMQANEAENGTIATAADNAFNAGAVVIAANGNFGPDSGTVRSPAIAHRVIGVGAYDVQTLATTGSQSRGPAPDGRFKPDVQAPTNTETASASSDTAMKSFGGTSGATPYAAGAAALMRNWLLSHSSSDPGQVYSRLIISGQRVYCCYDNEEGAGNLKMPVCGTANWGKVSIGGTGSTVNIPISIGSGKTRFDAALWWPEAAGEAHDDIDIYLIDPSGVERARGYSGVSVFERARADGPLAAGTWTVRIRGYSVSSGPQTVYWTADVHGC